MQSSVVEEVADSGLENEGLSLKTAPTIRVLMVAGGTGGHVFPALAVAEELRRRSQTRRKTEPRYEILFLGTRRGIEDRVIPSAGFNLRKISGAGLKGIGGWRRF